MKQQLSPAAFWAIIAVVVVVAVGVGYKMLGSPGYQKDETGGAEKIKEVQETGEFYKPPPGVPGISDGTQGQTGGPGGAPAGTGLPGYNMTPPKN